MKKVLIGISGLVVLAVATILFVNARNAPQEVKKPVTEMSEACGGCATTGTAACETKAETKTEPAPCCAAMAKK